MYVWLSVHDCCQVLKARFQTELGPNTNAPGAETNVVVTDIDTHTVVSTIISPHTTVSEVYDDVADPPAIVSDVHKGVTDTHPTVTNIDDNPAKSEEGGDGNDQSVSDTHVLSIV